MKKTAFMAMALILIATTLSACRSNKTTDTSVSTTAAPSVLPTIETHGNSAATAPTAGTTVPHTTQKHTQPENTTIGTDGTVGPTDTTRNTRGGKDTSSEENGRIRSNKNRTADPFRKF